MKILWFSNCSIVDEECVGSGSWLYGMRDIISSHVELYNITEAKVKSVQFKGSVKVKEYLIPSAMLSDEGLPPFNIIKSIKSIVETISPDVIHIWGLEKYWAKLFAYEHIKGNVLLEIQGVLSACSNVFWGGMTPNEIKKTHRLKEWIKPSVRLEAQYYNYIKKGQSEIELLKSFKYISTQSEWTRLQIKSYLNKDVIIYNTLRPIREEFYLAQKWESQNHKNPVLFTSLGYNVPFKGMHILLKAFRIVIERYPEAKLVIAGFNVNAPFYKINGYDRLLLDYIKNNNLTSHIELPGRLNASQVIEYLHSCDVYINPTFVESYSAATAEALFLGVPSVLSYAGALPYFKNNDEVAIFYPSLDFVDCASKISQLFEDKQLQSAITHNAILSLKKKSSIEAVSEAQLSIYKDFYVKNEAFSKIDI